MNKVICTLAFVSVISLASGCKGSHSGHNHDEPHTESEAHASHETHDAHGTHEAHSSHDEHAIHEAHDGDNHNATEHHHSDDEIELHAHQAEELGVKTDSLVLGEFTPAINVGGEVLVSPQSQGVITARTSGIVSLSSLAVEGAKVSQGSVVATVSASGMVGGDINQANRIAMEAAKTELDRITPLYEAGLVTAQEYQAAVTAYQIAANSSTGVGSSVQASSPISGVITSVAVENGSYVEAGSPIATVSSLGKMTIKADVPARYITLAGKATKANVECSDGTVLSATQTSTAPASKEMKGYFPMFFSVSNNLSLVPGSYVKVSLLAGKSVDALTVPKQSVVEKLGEKFVYVKVDDNCYRRCPVELGESDGTRYVVKSGLHAGDKVVTEGVTFVRIAESAGAIPEGHSHSH